jgi:unspecific monooxygenase
MLFGDVSLPEGPPPTKDLGLRWLFQPYRFLRDTAERYGDTFTIDLGEYGPFVVFSNPRDIREIFTGDVHVFHAGAGNGVLLPFLGDGSLLLLEEEAHFEARRVLARAFHGDRIPRYGALIEEVTRDAVRRWNSGEVLRIQDEMQHISLEIILRGTFGLAGEELSELRTVLRDFLNDAKFNLALIGRLSDEIAESAAWRTFRESFSRIHSLVDAQIERARTHDAQGNRTDMLHVLLEARDDNGKGLSPDDLRDELLTLLVTGYETTATALAWALYWIFGSPAVEGRLLSELVGPPVEAATKSAYLDALCKEVLRIHPEIPIVARRLKAPVQIGGHSLPADITVAPCVYLTHHRDDLYPDPGSFRPERFLDRTYSPYEYLPFGGGARRCIGMALATWEMKVVLATLLPSAELELAKGVAVQPQRRSVTVGPSGGLPMRFRERIERGEHAPEHRAH